MPVFVTFTTGEWESIAFMLAEHYEQQGFACTVGGDDDMSWVKVACDVGQIPLVCQVSNMRDFFGSFDLGVVSSS